MHTLWWQAARKSSARCGLVHFTAAQTSSGGAHGPTREQYAFTSAAAFLFIASGGEGQQSHAHRCVMVQSSST